MLRQSTEALHIAQDNGLVGASTDRERHVAAQDGVILPKKLHLSAFKETLCGVHVKVHVGACFFGCIVCECMWLPASGHSMARCAGDGKPERAAQSAEDLPVPQQEQCII